MKGTGTLRRKAYSGGRSRTDRIGVRLTMTAYSTALRNSGMLPSHDVAFDFACPRCLATFQVTCMDLWSFAEMRRTPRRIGWLHSTLSTHPRRDRVTVSGDLIRQPDHSIGRGSPPLKFQQLRGHRPVIRGSYAGIAL
jgi:hypothetical protein